MKFDESVIRAQLSTTPSFPRELESSSVKEFSSASSFPRRRESSIPREGGDPVLNKKKISSFSLECFDTIDSTNTYLLSKAKGELQSGHTVVADQQTAGRGRRGRQWVSLPGSHLYCSMLWVFPPNCSLVGLSLTIGVALVRALERMDIHGVQLKWPNDLFFNHCKLGGILIESFMDPRECCRVVIGIGLNLTSSDLGVSSISQPAIALEDIILKKINRDILLGIMLDELLMILPEFQAYGFERFIQEWQALDILANLAVQVETLQGIEHGIAQGVDVNGALQVKVNEEIKKYLVGEVSVRLG